MTAYEKYNRTDCRLPPQNDDDDDDDGDGDGDDGSKR